MKTLSQDTFFHSTEIEECFNSMIKESSASWAKAEAIKEIKAEIMKLKRFVITVEREE